MSEKSAEPFQNNVLLHVWILKRRMLQTQNTNVQNMDASARSCNLSAHKAETGGS